MANSVGSGKSIVGNGLVFCLDALDLSCYPDNGTVVTDLVSGITGSLNNANTVIRDGVSQTGYFDFDSTVDGMDLPNSTTSPSTEIFAFGSNPYTISCFYKYEGDQVMWSSGQTGTSNFYISITSTFLGLGDQGAYKHRPLRTNNDGNWFHWALVREGTGTNESKWYINGSLFSTGTDATTWISAGTHGTQINRYTSSPAEGLVGPLQIYNRGLTTDEVLQNFNAHKSRFGL